MKWRRCTCLWFRSETNVSNSHCGIHIAGFILKPAIRRPVFEIDNTFVTTSTARNPSPGFVTTKIVISIGRVFECQSPRQIQTDSPLQTLQATLWKGLIKLHNYNLLTIGNSLSVSETFGTLVHWFPSPRNSIRTKISGDRLLRATSGDCFVENRFCGRLW